MIVTAGVMPPTSVGVSDSSLRRGFASTQAGCPGALPPHHGGLRVAQFTGAGKLFHRHSRRKLTDTDVEAQILPLADSTSSPILSTVMQSRLAQPSARGMLCAALNLGPGLGRFIHTHRF